MGDLVFGGGVHIGGECRGGGNLVPGLGIPGPGHSVGICGDPFGPPGGVRGLGNLDGIPGPGVPGSCQGGICGHFVLSGSSHSLGSSLRRFLPNLQCG